MHSSCTLTLCGYYNMIHKKLMWITRENHESPDEEEEVLLGIDATGHSIRIRTRLNEMFR